MKPRPGHSGAEVAEHQLGRIHAATIDLVAAGGYNALSATAVARAAGVSKRTFYENFSGKEECFLATYDLIVRHVVREVLAVQLGKRDWREQVRMAFRAFLQEIVDNPQAARLALLDAFDGGPAAFDRMRHTFGLFEALVAESFAKAGDGIVTPPLLVRAIVAGTARVARANLLATRAESRGGDADALVGWTLALRSAEAEAAFAARAADPKLPEPGLQPDRHRYRPDERTAILDAAIGIASSDGYAALSAPRIRLAAGVPRRRFEAHFDGVADCFLAAVELRSERALKAARHAYLGADSWPAGVHRAIEAVCGQIAAGPAVSRVALGEVLIVGRAAIFWRAGFLTELGDLLRASAPPELRPTTVATEASVAAAWALVHHCVMAGRARQLPRMSGSLSYLVLTPSIGAAAAVEVIRRATPHPCKQPAPRR